ncbi:MAG: type II toxin-antitoxin system VapC family toxin [Gloeobacteraceae cyanobacterium ES-bin-144]|nr:type II toxin-antitoxin system VapC family toxin [Verrucomicrobiales bacterium]
MVIAADTSFLFALYGNDCHSTTAAAWISESTDPIQISVFNDFELRNALRFSDYSKRVNPGTSASQLALFENAIGEGRLVLCKSNLAEILSEASRLSLAHTLTGGHRGFDILHVAAAKILGATHFLTFDANQKKLAESESLIAPL